MTNKISAVLSGALSLAAGFVSLSAAADQQGTFYVAPSIYVAQPDAQRDAQLDYGAELSAGMRLGRRWAVELYSDSDKFKANNGSTVFEQKGLGVQGSLKPFPQFALTPVVLGGGGWLHTEMGGESDDTATARAGLGMRWEPPRSPLSLRADAVVRHEFDSKLVSGTGRFDDLIYSLGLAYSFGPPVSSGQALPSLASVPASMDRNAGSVTARPVSAHEPARPEAAFAGGHMSPGIETAADLDGDGVDNNADRCPDTPGTAVVDADGCIIYIKKNRVSHYE